MNEEQVKTQEFIFRNQENKQEEKKKNNGIPAKIIACVCAFAVIAAAVIFSAAVRGNAQVKETVPAEVTQPSQVAEQTETEVTAPAEPSQTVAIGDTEEVENRQEESENAEDSEPSDAEPEQDSEKEETEPTNAADETPATSADVSDEPVISDEEEGEEKVEPSYVDSTETIGLFGTGADIMDLYRADDPALPSYLTRGYNEKYLLDLSTDDIELLMHLVEAEAPAEDIYGKILVANVVLNRTVMGGWGNGVSGVIYKKFGSSVQFASTVHKAYWNSIKVSDSTREAVMRALAGEDYSNGALFFIAWKKLPELTPTTGWTKNYKYLFKHGGHAFYK